MSFIVVQFWGTFLPIIEIPMGDVPGGSQPPGNYPIPPQAGGPTHSRLSSPGVSKLQEITEQYRDLSTATFQHGNQPSFPFQPQQQFTSPYQTRQNLPTPLQTNLTTSQANMAQTQVSERGSPFNMASLGGALPDSPSYGQGFVQQASQRFPSGPSQAALMYQLQQTAQFPGQMATNQQANPAYNMQYPQQYQGKYTQQTPPLLQQPGSSPGPQFVTNQGFISTVESQQIPLYYYQPGASQYGQQAQGFPANQPQMHSASYGRRVSQSGEGALPPQQRSGEHRGGQGAQGDGSLRRASGTGMMLNPQENYVCPHCLLATMGDQTSILRGPPRKPKQSGHALWVGNLPPGANVVDLKDHFSRDATNDILSVFLISKSNCAFVNYNSEESCSAAMTRFHDSCFQGVRLVCRLRRTSVNPTTVVQTGPAAASGSSPAVVEPALEVESAVQEPETSTEVQDATPGTSLAKDKFFIVKSLTVEDLKLSVRNGVWATQSHNEEALNKAYEVREKTIYHGSQLIGNLVCGERLLDLLCQQIRRIFWLCTNDLSY
jgi:hypothetical protein